MYERFLLLNMNIEINEVNTIVNITMKNVKNHSDYKVVFEENDNNFKRKCCVSTVISSYSVFCDENCIYKILFYV